MPYTRAYCFIKHHAYNSVVDTSLQGERTGYSTFMLYLIVLAAFWARCNTLRLLTCQWVQCMQF